MKGFLRPKLILPLVTIIVLLGVSFAALAGNLVGAHAQGAFALSFTKAAPATVAQGGTIPYTFTLTNTSTTGTEPIHDLHVTDTLPSGLTAITAGPTFTVTPTGGASVDCSATAFPTVSCTLDDFVPGAVVTITFSASVSSTATGTIHNVATAQSTTTPVTATATASTIIVIVSPVTHKNSPNWGGYVSIGTKYTDVKGSWTVPMANCSKTPDANVSIWVGLDGYLSDTVEQTGTAIFCRKGKPDYFGWYELAPDDFVRVQKTDPQDVVKPGDKIQAEVKFVGHDLFVFNLSDSTQGWNFATLGTRPGAKINSAEWIVEANAPHLTDFGTITFTNCSANNLPINGGPTTISIDIRGEIHTDIDLVILEVAPFLKPLTAKVSPLNSSGTSFHDTWIRQ